MAINCQCHKSGSVFSFEESEEVSFFPKKIQNLSKLPSRTITSGSEAGKIIAEKSCKSVI